MPMYTRSTGATAVLPDALADLIVEPLQRDALAFAPEVATTLTIGTTDVRIPKVATDPTAAWVLEGEEIPASDAALAEITVTPSKVAGLTVISRELADDSSPEAAGMVGDGLARSIAGMVDAALFGTGGTGPIPAGLGSLPTTGADSVNVITSGSSFSSTDPFAEAASAVEQAGGSVTAFITSPAEALALAKVREGTGSNRTLLGLDPTQPSRRVIEGRPLIVSPAVAPKTVWAVDATRVFTVLREGTEVETSADAYFTSDRVAVRAVCRIGFGFPSLRAITKITHT